MIRPYAHVAVLIIVVAAAAWYMAGSRTEEALWDGVAEFDGVSLRLDYATTPQERERGLAGRVLLPEDHGMLFVFPEDGYHSFWMKDTLIPLDIFWLDAQRRVVHIAREVATSTYPHVFRPLVPARYVLELPAGFARLHDIATGTPVRLNFPISVSE